RRRRARGSGGARGTLARVRRLVGRGLEPRGVGRLAGGGRPLPDLPRPPARRMVRGGGAGLTLGHTTRHEPRTSPPRLRRSPPDGRRAPLRRLPAIASRGG